MHYLKPPWVSHPALQDTTLWSTRLSTVWRPHLWQNAQLEGWSPGVGTWDARSSPDSALPSTEQRQEEAAALHYILKLGPNPK